jgi:hypothetical protein
MLVLGRVGDGYRDDTNPAIRYRVPSALRPLVGSDGPQATLTRSPDGGLLHLRLGAQWPAFGPDDRPVPFEDGRFRLLLQTPIAIEKGEWRSTALAGDVLVERSVSLSPAEAAIARHLGERSGDLVDVEIELGIRGVARGFPWLASVPTSTLRPRLAALLGSSPVTWDAVEAAFLGLAEDTFTWYPLQAGAMRPPLDDALRAIARGAVSTLLTGTSAGWALADNPPARIDVNLQVTSLGTERIGYRWSFSDFLAAQADPGRFLSDVTVPAPFAAAEITIVNDVPLAADGLRSIALEVRTGGPTGIVRHEFVPGQPGAARVRFVRETFEDLHLQWGGRFTVMTANGPAVTPLDFRPCDQLIEIDAAALKLVPLRFAAVPAIFDLVASLEITIGARTLVLNRAVPEAWAVGRQAPATVAVTAVLPSGERRPLGVIPVGPLGVVLDPARLGAGEVAPVIIRPAADLAQHAAYLAVQPEGRPWRTLEPGTEIALPVRRESRLTPPRLRYRTRHVPRRPDGTTAPMIESGWRDASGDAVAVSV